MEFSESPSQSIQSHVGGEERRVGEAAGGVLGGGWSGNSGTEKHEQEEGEVEATCLG